MESMRSLMLLLLPTIAVVAMTATSWALEANKDGWYHTGDAVRVKKVAFISVKVYAIGHDTKRLPDAKSKQAMIDLDADKRFNWRMLRDVDPEKIQNALKEAYQMNGYPDAAKIAQFLGAFTRELKGGATVSIAYDANAKATTIRVAGDGAATVAGVDFMKATWAIWFGKIDQADLGDALLSKM
jgi:hypothetical protein